MRNSNQSTGSLFSNAYCETKEDADEVFEERIKTCEGVRILVGYPGEWELVKEWHKNYAGLLPCLF